ncbi:heme transporter HemC [Rhizobium sp. R72]|uniref:heme ABC transporter permease n=1 Tax=unclassified Rhizobium TaxID=2613769 RepID=UPI000B532025|nr:MULTISPECIES: heme ABC transporter permease [unclassified Rhizobium]OWV96078.1 heme transporter HemC [Rhizobium sp. R72]OWV96084.1 heme transporter HemC [Rhizobium sp. R711]
MSPYAQLKSTVAGLAQPTRFLEVAERVLPFLLAFTALCLVWGLYLSFSSDVDYQQGSTVRIMYVHVPAAWIAMLCYTVMTANAIGSIVWRHPLADVAARAAAPLGASFTFVSLVTGAIWGKPMWGTWWVWDARLTSMFILFIMYLGIVAINRAIDEPTRAARVTAVLIIVGFVNIPIIKFSVDWWNTLHQPASVLRLGGPALDIEFLRPLMVMGLAFVTLFFTLYLASIRNEIWRRKLIAQHRLAARSAVYKEY